MHENLYGINEPQARQSIVFDPRSGLNLPCVHMKKLHLACRCVDVVCRAGVAEVIVQK